MMDRSRRNFIKTSAGVAGLCLAGPSAVARVLSADEPEHPSGRLVPSRWVRFASLPESSRSRRRSMRATWIRFRSIGCCIPFASRPAYPPALRRTKVGKILPANCAAISPADTSCRPSRWLRPLPETCPQERGDDLVSGLGACQKKDRHGYLSAYPSRTLRTPGSGQAGMGALLHLPQDHGRPA